MNVMQLFLPAQGSVELCLLGFGHKEPARLFQTSGNCFHAKRAMQDKQRGRFKTKANFCSFAPNLALNLPTNLLPLLLLEQSEQCPLFLFQSHSPYNNQVLDDKFCVLDSRYH